METGNRAHRIKKVLPGSIAKELDIAPGDRLIAINDTPVEDIFDYQFLVQDTYIEVLIEKPDKEQWLLEVDKEADEDLGIEFENGLMDEYRHCHNKCILTRCRRECEIPCILRTMIPGFPSYREIM